MENDNGGTTRSDAGGEELEDVRMADLRLSDDGADSNVKAATDGVQDVEMGGVAKGMFSYGPIHAHVGRIQLITRSLGPTRLRLICKPKE